MFSFVAGAKHPAEAGWWLLPEFKIQTPWRTKSPTRRQNNYLSLNCNFNNGENFKLDRCPELIPDVPRVEETQVTYKGFIHPCREESKVCDQNCCELTWATTMVNVHINKTNDGEG